MIPILIFIVLHWYLSLFIQTFFHHRYAAHQQFTMSPFWERFFFVVAFILQGSCYMSPKAYAILHRQHHAFTDKEGDPHSPKDYANMPAMMLGTKYAYEAIFKNKADVDPKFTKNVPTWDAFDRMGHSWITRLAWGTLYTLFYLYFAPSYWLLLLLPYHYLQAAIHGAIINCGAHKYGYQNFEMDNTATNLMPWDVFMMGEGLHNNHHKFPASANFGQKWYEFDPTWWLIKGLNSLGVVKLAKA